MKSYLPLGRASASLCSGIAALLFAIGVPAPVQAADPTVGTPEELEIDRQHLKQIFAAIQSYKEKTGGLPNWLSDLVPDYIKDTNILMSPVELRTGRSQLWGYGDPKIRSSYIYEFNQAKAGGIRDQDIPLTMKEWKTRQMEEFGPVIPILRCHLHEQVLNLAYSGDVYLSGLFWESDTNTLGLMEKLGPGPGASKGRKLAITVLDTERKPMSGVDVLVTNRESEFGPLPPRRSKTDENGVCQVNLGGEQPKSVSFELRKTGYAGVSVNWTDAASIPEGWAVALERAALIGGKAVDGEGKPIANAVVIVNGYTKDEVGQVVPTRYDRVTTAADGSWATGQVPEKFESLSLLLSHPEFMPAEYELADEPGRRNVTREALLAKSAKLTLDPGIEVRGTVVTKDDKRVPGATVQLTIEQEQRPVDLKTQTDTMGMFRIVATVLGEATISVQATNLAPGSKSLEVRPDIEPFVIRLDEGRTISGRVVDDAGKPLGDVEVTVARWEGGIVNWRTRTGADGQFEWRHAPTGPTALYFSKQGYVGSYQQEANVPEWVVRLERPFRLTGRVVDAETGEPIRKFTMRRGYSYGRFSGEEETYRWQDDLNHPGDSTFDTTGQEESMSGMSTKFAVWAEGYLPATSPSYDRAGNHEHVFKLRRGTGLAGVVKLEAGEAVAGATLYLATVGNGVYMDKPGEFRKQVTRCQSTVSDEQGRFQFMAELDQRSIFVAHDKGFAELPVAADATNVTVIIKPWASVKGRLKFRNPGPEQSVTLQNMWYRYANTGPFNSFSLFIDAKPDEDGSFLMDRVPPGARRLYVRYKFHEGPGVIPMSHGVFVRLEPGECREVNFGDGRTVVGRVQVPDDLKDRVDWFRDLHKLTLKIVDENEPQGGFRLSGALSEEERSKRIKEYNEQQRAYWTSAAGRAREEQSREYLVLFDEEGAFRVEGVAPGKYTLNITLTEPRDDAGRNFYYGGQPLGSVVQDVDVTEGDADKPLDLGILELRKAPSPTALRRPSF